MSMKKITFLLSAAVIFYTVKLADDIISKLGMQERNAQYYILSNFVGDFNNSWSDEEDDGSNDAYEQMKHFRVPYAKLLPSIISGDKAGAAKEICDYIKLYINSQNFIDDYNARRTATKPTSEPWKPDAETIKTQRQSIKEMEAQLAQMKKDKQMPQSSLQSMESTVNNMKKQLAEWEDPHPNLTKWEKKYPADPSVLIKAKLEEYLALVATVDFSAQLSTDKYNNKIFVNPAYEKKSLKWKACFRAGKEVNAVITAFVKEWLKGEIIAANKTTMPLHTETPVPVKNKPEAATPAASSPSTPATDNTPATKPKKSLFNKIKDKANNVIGNK